MVICIAILYGRLLETNAGVGVGGVSCNGFGGVFSHTPGSTDLSHEHLSVLQQHLMHFYCGLNKSIPDNILMSPLGLWILI